MKVIMKQTVPKVGKEGQVVSVADGFARNFLFPKRLAIVADRPRLALLAREAAKVEAELEKTRSAAEKIGEKLSGATIRITGSTAKGATKLFGAVTANDIAEAVKDQLGVEVEKRAVALMHPIKRLGVYDVMIDLHRDVDATVRLEVADEHGYLGIEETVVEEATPEQLEEGDTAAGIEKPADEPAPEEPATEAPVAETAEEEKSE